MNQINNNTIEKEYDELSIIISQQEILQQKVGILMAINTLFIGFILSLSFMFSYWIFLLLFFPVLAIMINVYILYPNFSQGRESKYFYDFADMNEKDISKNLNKENTLNQIKINSKILKNKYISFKWSLILSFFMIPLIFEIINKLRRNK